MAEEQDIKQETVDETAKATNVEEPAVEETEEVVADAAHVLDELKADFDNRYKRLQADFENFKRRTNQEKEQLAGYVKGDVLTDLLPVLDNLERSQNVQDPSDEVKSFLKGYEMITKQFVEALKKHGIEHIEVEGKEFDPNFHQAVMMVSDENYGHNMIVEELQKGYKLKDRVIRASLVKVNE